MSQYLDRLLDIERVVDKALTQYGALPPEDQQEAAESIAAACILRGKVAVEKAKATSKEDYEQ